MSGHSWASAPSIINVLGLPHSRLYGGFLFGQWGILGYAAGVIDFLKISPRAFRAARVNRSHDPGFGYGDVSFAPLDLLAYPLKEIFFLRLFFITPQENKNIRRNIPKYKKLEE